MPAPQAQRPDLRVGFAGTPAFAAQALAAIVQAGFAVPLVLTQPDRPAGRGMKLTASPVKQLALEAGLAVLQPQGLKRDGRFAAEAVAAHQAIAAAQLDVLVVAAYGLILPASVLALPALGCLNIHASLLPRWRGAAPIQRAIEAGDSHTGICIMQMDEGLDTGAVIAHSSLAIAAQDTAATLHDRLAALGAKDIVRVLNGLGAAPAPSTPQPEAGISYAAKLSKAEAAIDWQASAVQIERRIRAFDPVPGASFAWPGEAVKLWAAELAAHRPLGLAPGTLYDDGGRWAIACGEGGLVATQMQRAGGKRLAAAQVWAGLAPQAGEALPLPVGQVLPPKP